MLELSTEIQGKVKEATDEMAANFIVCIADIYRLIFPDGSTEQEDNELFGMIMTSFLNSIDEFKKQAMKES